MLLTIPADRRAGDRNRDTTMYKTVKTLAALTFSLTILSASPAMAAMTANGLWQNGLWQNGVFQNGVFQNGIWQNGVSMNGQQADAPAVRVIGIELPSEAAVR
jgi:hypothetical protein